jgi:hypothetical protein
VCVRVRAQLPAEASQRFSLSHNDQREACILVLESPEAGAVELEPIPASTALGEGLPQSRKLLTTLDLVGLPPSSPSPAAKPREPVRVPAWLCFALLCLAWLGLAWLAGWLPCLMDNRRGQLDLPCSFVVSTLVAGWHGLLPLICSARLLALLCSGVVCPQTIELAFYLSSRGKLTVAVRHLGPPQQLSLTLVTTCLHAANAFEVSTDWSCTYVSLSLFVFVCRSVTCVRGASSAGASE